MATAQTSEKKAVKGMLTDEKFPLSGRSLHLSVEIRAKEVLCCLLDKHSNQYIALNTLGYDGKTSSLEGLLKDNILSTEASGISVVFAQNSSILVPAPFFKKELLNDYLGLQQLDKVNETPCFDHITNLDSYNLYTVHNDLLTLVRKHYPGASFRHASSIFIEYILIENKHHKDSKTFVSVYDSFMDVIILKEGKLTLSNRFYYSNGNDFIYHLLWVYEQLGLDNEKVPCVFYGDIDTSSDTYAIAGKYIKQVSLGGKNEQSRYAPALALLPAHKYRSLFTQYLCV